MLAFLETKHPLNSGYFKPQVDGEFGNVDCFSTTIIGGDEAGDWSWMWSLLTHL